MKKLRFKKSGREAKMGEKLIRCIELFGMPIPVEEIEVNKTTIPILIKEGILVEEGSDTDIDITMEGAVLHLANRIGWDKENLEKYLRNLHKISPTAIFEIILKELAIMLDEKYQGHISNSKEIWVINKINGEAQKLEDKSKIKNYRHFAAFRNLEDALIAKKIMAPALEDLYGK